MIETEYCNGCEFAYLCYGVDMEQCESYKERRKRKILEEEKER